jgi:hypothetical protein
VKLAVFRKKSKTRYPIENKGKNRIFSPQKRNAKKSNSATSNSPTEN